MPLLPDKFNSWNEETQAAVRDVFARQPYASASGHGSNNFILIPNPDRSEGKPTHVSLGFEVTLPKTWTWDQCEPFLWKMAAAFIKYQTLLSTLDAMAVRGSHEWKLKPGWRQFYECAKCGVSDVDDKAEQPCPRAVPGSSESMDAPKCGCGGNHQLVTGQNGYKFWECDVVAKAGSTMQFPIDKTDEYDLRDQAGIHAESVQTGANQADESGVK